MFIKMDKFSNKFEVFLVINKHKKLLIAKTNSKKIKKRKNIKIWLDQTPKMMENYKMKMWIKWFLIK